MAEKRRKRKGSQAAIPAHTICMMMNMSAMSVTLILTRTRCQDLFRMPFIAVLIINTGTSTAS